MARCDHCGNEVVLPFSCQYCGRKHCPGCRLPPSHQCVNIALWNSKPRPAVGMSYHKGGGVSATGGVAADVRRRTAARAAGKIPYLKIMAGVIVLILLGLAWLVLGGH